MRKLNFEAPINSLSLGNVSVNFLKEIYNHEDIDASIFPIGDNADFNAYDNITDEFKNWIISRGRDRLKTFCSDAPTLKVWHINGSERQIGKKQFLYTFYEVDSPTQEEINIVKAQEHVFFSSSESAEFFKNAGCDNVSYVPLGFDKDFFVSNKDYGMNNTIHFGLIGKLERRKNTQAIIQLWLNKFGNNPKYHLTCLINNPFLKPEHMNQAIGQALMGRNWNNISFLPHLKTNAEVNDLMNSVDIDLSGLSNGEGWNLPAFNTTALGKWSIVSNCTSHKDWANDSNAILVNPVGKQPCYDNVFFQEGSIFNQGNYYKLDAESISVAMDKAIDLAKKQNTEGLKLQEQFSYKESVEKILKVVFK
jgi:hypothetical protein